MCIKWAEYSLFKLIDHPKILIIIFYSPSCNYKPVWPFFCETKKKIFWRMLVTKLFWFPLTSFFPLNRNCFPKYLLFCFTEKQKSQVSHVWNDTRVKWWQNFYFWVNYPFKTLQRDILDTFVTFLSFLGNWYFFSCSVNNVSLSISR